MKFGSFSNKITKNVSDADFSLIEKAYKFADRAHKGQTRASGEHFIEHSVSVADILFDLGLPPVVLTAALLHDVVEDSKVSLKLLGKIFGNDRFQDEFANIMQSHSGCFARHRSETHNQSFLTIWIASRESVPTA